MKNANFLIIGGLLVLGCGLLIGAKKTFNPFAAWEREKNLFYNNLPDVEDRYATVFSPSPEPFIYHKPTIV
jgi:hypothetical protein